MSVPESTLERLLIEVVGDDKNLQAALDAAVKAAQEAAAAMRAALDLDFSKVTAGATQVAEGFEKVAPSVADVNTVMDQFAAGASRAFDKVVAAGEKSERQFEEYRQAALEAIDTQRPLAQALGYTGTALDDLAKKVKETTYEQAQASKETERTKQEQEALADTMRRLSNLVRSSRSDWAGRLIEDKQFRESTEQTRDEMIKLLGTLEKGSDAYRKLSQDIAYAQRGLDSANQVASRGGLAWTAQIAIANQFGQSLRNLGPEGQAAAAGLGLVENSLGRLIPRVKEGDSRIKAFGLTALRFALVWYPVASALAPLVGAGLLFKLSSDAAKAARELENASYRTGLTVEGLQELQHAARSTGVPLELLSTTMQRLQRRAADANAGNKGLQQAFRNLGVTLTDENGKMRTTEDLLGQVADGLNRVQSDADRLALAFKVFDTEGGRLLPLLAEGSEGIKRLREEARELGLVVSGDTVMSLSQLDAEIKTVMQQFSVLRMEVAGAFLPLMQGALLPLISQKLVPALQGAADALVEFTEQFFDATEAGEAFRRDTVKNLQSIVILGKGVVAGAQTVWGAVNSILGAGAYAFGAGQGAAWWRDQADEILAQRARIQASIDESRRQLRMYQQDPETHAVAISQTLENIARAEAALSELPANLRQAMQIVADEVSGPMWDQAWAGFSGAMGTIETDFVAQLEALLGGTDFTRSARRAGRNAGDEFGGGFGDGSRVALEGSLKYAQEQLSKAQEDLAYAVGAEARAAALLTVEAWEEAVALIEAELAAFDPAKAAKLWTGPLAAELQLGMKTPAQVLELIQPTLERLRVEAANALSEFGFDSTQYQDLVAQLQVVEGLLSSINGEAVKLAAPAVTVVIDDATEAALAFLKAQREAREEAGRIADTYAQLVEMGASLEDRMAFLEGTPFAGAVIGPPGGVVDLLAWSGPVAVVDQRVEALTVEIQRLLKAGADELEILNAIERLTSITPMSVLALDELTGGWYTARNAAESYRQASVDAFDEAPGLAFDPSVLVATLDARLAPALEAAREKAAALGLEFDSFTARQEALAGIVADLGGRFGELTDGELAVLRLAVAELAELDARSAAQDADALFTAWLQGVNRLGVSLDPLDQAALTLAEMNLQGDDLTEALAALAAAGDRLEQAAFDATFEAWADAVSRLGVASDPIGELRAQLELMFAGRDDAEAYAAALELLADAQERLRQAEEDAAFEKASGDWAAASASMDAFLQVNQANFDQLREAAQAAFDAGIIGAEDLAEAMQLIGTMELVENFRILAGELDGLQSLVPNLMADFTQAFAQLAAGNTTDAIATAFNAATMAVEQLGAAFEDTEHQAEAVLDLVIGAAAGIATAIGGPAMGQAVGAIGGFIKSILGDLSNGLAAIEKQVNQTATGSRYLGEELVRGIAEGATRTVSRGGLLGALGFTKQALDEDAFRAGISTAEGFASGLVGTLRAGDFEKAWKQMIDDIIIDGMIQAFMATAAVQEAIQTALGHAIEGNFQKAAEAIDKIRGDAERLWRSIQAITGVEPPAPPELDPDKVRFELPDATVSVLAAPQWALELEHAAARMVSAGDAMLTAADMMQDAFNQPIPVRVQQPRGIDANRSL